MLLLKGVSKEFTLTNFGLNHFQPIDFVTSQWQYGTKSRNYVIYRWLVAIVFITSLVMSLSEIQNTFEWKIWSIYLTRWGLLLNVFTYFLGAVLASLQYANVPFQDTISSAKRLPPGIQIYWALHTITVTLALIITLVYWTLVYDYDEQKPITMSNILNHVVNSVVLIIDMLVVGHPHRLYHFVYTQLLIVLFALFSVIYYMVGGINEDLKPYIYAMLDWSKANTTILYVIGVIIFVAFAHFFVHMMYRIRVTVHSIRTDKQGIITGESKKSTINELDNHGFDETTTHI